MSSPLILSICSYVLFLNQEQNQESWLSIVLISINLLSKKKSYKNKDFFTQVVSYKEICFSIFLFANQLLKVSIFSILQNYNLLLILYFSQIYSNNHSIFQNIWLAHWTYQYFAFNWLDIGMSIWFSLDAIHYDWTHSIF